jgi:aldehyde dehydrogenase (NAD+)
VERLAAGNMKRSWVNYGRARDWTDAMHGAAEEFRTRATEVKNIWIPYGE